jgi:hypothetical protein
MKRDKQPESGLQEACFREQDSYSSGNCADEQRLWGGVRLGHSHQGFLGPCRRLLRAVSSCDKEIELLVRQSNAADRCNPTLVDGRGLEWGIACNSWLGSRCGVLLKKGQV